LRLGTKINLSRSQVHKPTMKCASMQRDDASMLHLDRSIQAALDMKTLGLRQQCGGKPAF